MDNASRECGAIELADVSLDAMRKVTEKLTRDGLSGPQGIIDCDSTLHRLDGDWELYRDLLGFYFDDSPKLLEAVGRAIESSDSTLLRHNAHQLKGLVSNFDAQQAVAAALRLERMGNDGVWDEIEVAQQQLEQEIERLSAVLRQYCLPAPH